MGVSTMFVPECSCASSPSSEKKAHRLAVAIRAAAGIEPFIWLTGIADLCPKRAGATMRATARAILEAELAR
jgi:hypothetical protein